LDTELSNTLPPDTPFREYFGPDYTLHPDLNQGRYENKNTRKYLETARQKVMEQLRYLKGAPSVQMQEIPPDIGAVDEDYEDELREDAMNDEKERKRMERMVVRPGELL